MVRVSERHLSSRSMRVSCFFFTRSSRMSLHVLEAVRDARVVAVLQAHGECRRASVDVGDARAHQPGAEHGDLLDRARLDRGIVDAGVLLQRGRREEEIRSAGARHRRSPRARRTRAASTSCRRVEALLGERLEHVDDALAAPGSARRVFFASSSLRLLEEQARGRPGSPRARARVSARRRARRASWRACAWNGAPFSASLSGERRRRRPRGSARGTTSSATPSCFAFAARMFLPVRP